MKLFLTHPVHVSIVGCSIRPHKGTCAYHRILYDFEVLDLAIKFAPWHTFHDLDTPLLAFCTADLGLRSKNQSIKCLSSEDKKYGFQGSLNYGRPRIGPLDDILSK